MFIALRHEKILSCYVNLLCCIQMGGWGGGGGVLTFIALRHQKMLLHCRCFCVEDVVTLKMLLR